MAVFAFGDAPGLRRGGLRTARPTLAAHMEALAQGGFDLGEIVADGLADSEMPEHAGAGEFVDGAYAQAAVSSHLFAGDLPGQGAGSGGVAG